MNAIEFIPEIASSEESPIEFDKVIIGWHVVLFDQNKNALGGGFHKQKDVARRIAIAEVCERKLFRQLKESPVKLIFDLNNHPSTCGFAAGFESDKTRYRAIAEAIERWTWSKWIDEQYYINKATIDFSELSEVSKFFYKMFDSVIFFEKTISTNAIPNFTENIKIGIVLGFKNGGVFPGSRAAISTDEIWDHAFIEAWRHSEIFIKYKGSLSIPFPYGRIFHFGNNGNEAIEQIQKANKLDWPNPQQSLILDYHTGVDGLFLWRSIMKDFMPWSSGNEKRFVY
jgi:hypothetical protein